MQRALAADLDAGYHPRTSNRATLYLPRVGALSALAIELALLDGWFARDTADILVGEIRGDTIVGEYRLNGGRVRFVKRR